MNVFPRLGLPILASIVNIKKGIICNIFFSRDGTITGFTINRDKMY